MHKHRNKINSDDEDIRSQKSYYTNVSKIGSIPSKNVELCLEVEMDDEVREMIKSPQKSPSTLLDVTVIKPKGLHKYTTEKQILKTDQVRKLITSMKLDNGNKKTLMDKIFGEYGITNCISEKSIKSEINQDKILHMPKEFQHRKSCLSPRNKRTFQQSSVKLDQGDIHCITDDTNSAVCSMYKQKETRFDNKRTQQIYTTPKTYQNIRTMFACKNPTKHNEDEKLEQPCLCQNCAIVGILTDAQKRPFATEPMPDPMELKQSTHFRKPVRKKSVTFKHLEDLPCPVRSHSECQAVFKLLSARINELEKRVAMQEEKAVPKDYFKKIITKLVNHLSKLTHYTTEEKSGASSSKQKHQPSFSKYMSSDKYNKYYVSPLLVENTYKIPAEKEFEPLPCSSTEPPKMTSGIWKWGEDFLRPGRDLKNKVVELLEETLHNLKKGWERPEAHTKLDQDLQCFVEELSKNLSQAVKLSRNKPQNNSRRSHLGKVSNSNVSAATTTEGTRNREKKSIRPSMIPRLLHKKGPLINVAYVNPQLKKWPEESQVSFKIDSSDYESHKGTMNESKKKQYKMEFLKVLENTKTGDKFKLWQNIWNQALQNGQSKNDSVTIQIPDPKDLLRQKMIHLEYSIGEMEKLLIGNIENSKKK